MALAAATLTAACSATAHAAVPAAFTINQAQSELTVGAEARGFSDTDTQALRGTVDALFGFGTSGVLPPAAELTVTGSHVTSAADFRLRLGLPFPFPAVTAVASGLVADVTTPLPPGLMTKTAAPGHVYEFDASQFLVTLNQGTIVLSGLVNDTVNLADEPVSGASPAGTIGRIEFTIAGTSGPFTRLNAALTLPLDISETATFGEPEAPEEVMLDLDGTIRATASFYVALAGLAGDFDADSDVDGADLPLWAAGFGTTTGADPSDGDADGDADADGADFLTWQKNVGLAPPPLAAAAAQVPEPASAAIASILASAGAWRFKRRRC